ncbi:MAG: hypothetical protein CSA75_04000, partial [Sorangium cellulosum]
LYTEVDEVESAASALAHASRLHADPSTLLERAHALGDVTSADAAICLMQTRARAYKALGDHQAASEAWLALGSARWERANDRMGAISAWLTGRGQDSAAGFASLSESLASFVDGQTATAAIRDFGLACDDPIRAASALVVAAARVYALGQFTEALDLSIQALRQDPRRTDALTIVERASDHAGGLEAFEQAHSLVASGAKGRYGRRAAHFRAARNLEHRGHPELAVVHAMAAFEADPVEGSVLAMMLRLAEHVEPTGVVDTLCRVAQASATPELRAHWWLQAAQVASTSPAHLKRSMDLCLRTFVCSPSLQAIERMGHIMKRLLERESDDATIFEMRLERARKEIATDLQGPIGGRIALAAAQLSASVLNSASLAIAWVKTALACSGDIDEYREIISVAEILAGDKGGCEAIIDKALERSSGLGGTTGPALCAFVRALSKAIGDAERQTQVDAAEAKSSDGSEKIAPFADLTDELAADSDQPPSPSPQSQPPESAKKADVETSKNNLPPAPWSSSSEALRNAQAPQLPSKAGLPKRTNNASLDPIAQAEQFEASGKFAAAIACLEKLKPHEAQPPHVDDLLRRLYEITGRNTSLTEVLDRIAQRETDPAKKLKVLVEVAGLRQARGDIGGARATWQRVTDIDPSYMDA